MRRRTKEYTNAEAAEAFPACMGACGEHVVVDVAYLGNGTRVVLSCGHTRVLQTLAYPGLHLVCSVCAEQA